MNSVWGACQELCWKTSQGAVTCLRGVCCSLVRWALLETLRFAGAVLGLKIFGCRGFSICSLPCIEFVAKLHTLNPKLCTDWCQIRTLTLRSLAVHKVLVGLGVSAFRLRKVPNS